MSTLAKIKRKVTGSLKNRTPATAASTGTNSWMTAAWLVVNSRSARYQRM